MYNSYDLMLTNLKNIITVSVRGAGPGVGGVRGLSQVGHLPRRCQLHDQLQPQADARQYRSLGCLGEGRVQIFFIKLLDPPTR